MQLKQKDCLYPEVSRNFNFGQIGANVQLLEYLQYFTKNQLQETFVQQFENVDQLNSKHYSNYMRQQITKAEVIQPTQVILLRNKMEAWHQKKEYHTIVTSFTKETYEEFKIHFKLFRTPYFGSFMNMIDFKPSPYVTVYLGNAKTSDLLPNDLQIKRKNIKEVIGKQGQSCSEVCKVQGLECLIDQMDYINSCNVLSKHFKCERGCVVETGSDLPCFVTDATNVVHYQQCLITEERTSCGGSHSATTRLCPCAPIVDT